MKRQIQTTKRMPLLDKKGRLRRPSWAADDLFLYNKPLHRMPGLNEWELYELSNSRYACQVLYGHTFYAAVAEAALVDFESGKEYTVAARKMFPGDSFDLDFSAGEPHRLKYEDSNMFLSLDFDGRYRRLRCRSKTLRLDIMFPDEGDAVATAVPFARKRQYACNYKKNFLDVRGEIKVNGLLSPLYDDSFVRLFSSRGVWPREANWVWGSGTQRLDGHILGVNLGWGFGNTTAATENALFWDGAVQKLGRVREACDYEDLMQPEVFTSDDGRLEATFTPRFDWFSERRFPRPAWERHRVYGVLNGRCVLDDGTMVPVQDMHFFCEHTKNRW